MWNSCNKVTLYNVCSQTASQRSALVWLYWREKTPDQQQTDGIHLASQGFGFVFFFGKTPFFFLSGFVRPPYFTPNFFFFFSPAACQQPAAEHRSGKWWSRNGAEGRHSADTCAAQMLWRMKVVVVVVGGDGGGGGRGYREASTLAPPARGSFTSQAPAATLGRIDQQLQNVFQTQNGNPISKRHKESLIYSQF